MRHSKHKHLLGVKSAHRLSLMANMCCALIENGRIRTTLAKAKALRPSIEKIITLAKKAHLLDDAAKKIHYRRLAIARLRNKKSVQKLFDELAEDFVNRTGGYTRIYKLAIPRLGDAADMAIIEFVKASDKGYGKRKGSGKKTDKKSKSLKSKQKKTEQEEADDVEEAVVEDTGEFTESVAPVAAEDNITDLDDDQESELETTSDVDDTTEETLSENSADEPVEKKSTDNTADDSKGDTKND
ncbi:MAG: 50S ribosomal protein L17 [Verrucomicrobia bacterium]|nr:50S ribosomal protein L17 [Verrucomicrobiota bacterium]MDA0722702.1 50S ribosomal protein L17 [Verrucomicrobiota bacterium]MDA1045515.1 50S ribosomal protein L17 [Verrucomicrobiota bacterium]